ncbi:peroxisomal trans-2-enoyl-CoA reductase-like [Glandiceps talaboti]
MAARGKVLSVFRSGLFSNSVAVVTGGGTGIGQAIARELLHLGCKVVIASRKIDRLQKAAEEMKNELEKDSVADIKAIECNIRKEDQVKSVVEYTLNTFGRIDYLVNNGGGQFISRAEDMTMKGWKAVVDTNLNGTFQITQEVYKAWMKDHGGSIVNIIVDNWNGFPGFAHTGAARAGIENFTKSLALEWAKDGVTINSVAPGTIYSDTAAANYGAGGDSIFSQSIPDIPLKRLGTLAEISAAVCFLLSPAATYITGTTLKVDGASSLYRHPLFAIPDHNRSKAYTWGGESSRPTLEDAYRDGPIKPKL